MTFELACRFARHKLLSKSTARAVPKFAW